MALTIQSQINGQQASGAFTYSYLYEPLRVVVTEDNLAATKLFIDLEVLDTTDDTVVVEELIRYGEFDINPGKTLSFDLMKIARQHHKADVFKFGTTVDISSPSLSGWEATVSKYKYNFKIYSDTSLRQEVRVLPLLGGRMLEQFGAIVNESNPVNEFEYYGLDAAAIKNKWTNNYVIDLALVDPTLQNAKPTISQSTGTGNQPCGGWLIWKSRFGGWMFWGFDIQARTFSGSHEGMLDVGMFESTKETLGSPYVAVDYFGIDTSYSITLKSLSLTSEELLAVAGISASPAVYYSKPNSTKLELMRLSSVTAPISNLAAGGDFSVTLQNISKTSQKTI